MRVQAYAGDELGYDKTAITKDMRIAVVDVGAVDGADDVTKVGGRDGGRLQSTSFTLLKVCRELIQNVRGPKPGSLVSIQVVVRGKVCPVVGYGGMNMHIIDITSVPDAEVGPCANPRSFQPCYYTYMMKVHSDSTAAAELGMESNSVTW